ncbi:MAG: DUF2299 domain-containing protein [Candidatus Lokiarchaeota archaeon]|nr:DUF2299 domain-containing protein [Candidatus Lokiarchaeota archaeon]
MNVRETIETIKRKFEGFLAKLEYLKTNPTSDKVVLVNLGARQREEVKEAIIQMKGGIKEDLGIFSDEFSYLFNYPHESGRPFHITKKRQDSFMIIWISIRFVPEHYSAFQELSDKKKKEFIISLHEIIIEKDLDFNFFIKPDGVFYEIFDIYLFEDIFEPISVRLLHKKVQKIFGYIKKTIFLIERGLGGNNKIDLTPYMKP